MEGVVTKEAGLGSRANTPLPAAKNKDVLWLITCISHCEAANSIELYKLKCINSCSLC